MAENELDNTSIPEGFLFESEELEPVKPALLGETEYSGDSIPEGFALESNQYKSITPRKPLKWEELDSEMPEEMRQYGARVKNSLSMSSTYDIPPHEAFAMEEGFTKYHEEPNLYDKALASFETGIGDVYVSMGSTMEWMGFSKEASDVYTNFGANLQQAYIPPMKPHEFRWSDMASAEWWATSGVRGVPFVLSLIPASIIGAYGGTATAGAVGISRLTKFGSFGTKTMGFLGAGVASRGVESAFEAGGARTEALEMGYSEEEAQDIGNQVFADNVKLAGVDTAQFALSFAPFGKIGGKAMRDVMALRIASVTGRVAGVGLTEGAEERYQTKVTLDALGKETAFFADDPQLNEATALGMVFGAGMAGTGSVWTAFRGEVVDTMPPEIKASYEEIKADLLAEGKDENVADMEALDAIADTTEGEAHIKETVESLQERAEAIPENIAIAREIIDKSEGQAEAEIVDRIATQLEATGIDEESARLQANILYGEPFKVLAKRAGITSEELAQRYAPEIGVKTDKDGVSYDQQGQVKTETSAFKQWFGDSQVVDEAGEPLVVYHGTEEQFDVFDVPAFFSTSARFSETFGEQVGNYHLSIKKPFDSTNKKHLEQLIEKVGSITDPFNDQTFISAQDFLQSEGAFSDTWEIIEPYIDNIKSLGFDGASIFEGGIKNLVAFQPNQIKSVNAELFDPSDPRILFQGGRDVDDKVFHEEQLEMFQAQKPKTFAEFIRSEGGLFDEKLTGDIEKFNLTRKTGKTVDEMGELAWQAGYFTERPTEAEFLDLLEQDATSPVYSSQEAEEAFEVEAEKIAEQLDPRARILFKGKDVFIDFLKDPDRSSFIHETGHLYLEMLKDLSDAEGVSADLVNDYATVRDWLGIKEGEQITTEQHEKWATGFEAYLMEGVAPTVELRGAFARMKEWLVSVYQTIDKLGVALTPEIRSVMDRLLVSQEDLAYVLTEADNALIDVVTEGKGISSVTDEDILKLIPDYEPVTGIKKVYGMIKEDVDLHAEWKETQEVARVAFKEGKEQATIKAKKKMQEVLLKAKVKSAKKIDKIQTEKQKMAKRRRTIKTITDYLGLTEAQIKKLTKRRNFSLMSDYEFKVFKDKMLIEAEQMQTTALEKARVMEVIQRKRLNKVENYQKALGLPKISDMTSKQLEEYVEALEQFEDGDTFLGQRQIETVDNTSLEGVRTWREAKEALAKEVSKKEGREVTVEELSNIVPPSIIDKATYDSALAERDPFFRMLVSETTKAIFDSEVVAHTIEDELQVLSKKSTESRGLTWSEKLIPQDKQVMSYLEASIEEKEGLAETMTPEQLDLAHFMNEYFGDALDYLIKTNTLTQGRENYFVHMRRSVIEDIKESGFKSAFKNIFKNYEQDEMVFTILDSKTGKVLPLNKHFQYAMRRSGNLEPTFNVVKAFSVYMKTLEKKKALDAILPKMAIYSQAIAPTAKTDRGLDIDPRIKDFVYTYLNNKKGRRVSFDSTIKQGGRIDLGIMFLRTFTAMMDLGLNVFTGVASLVGEQSGNIAILGAKKIATGEARTHTKKGKVFLKKYEAFTKRSFWQEFGLEGKEVTERFVETLFGLFHINAVKMNKQFLLGSITDEEYNSGELSSERLAELRLEMGRFRVVPNQKSILGSTSIGGAVTQYKTWAVPMATNTYKDIQKMVTDLRNKPTGEALTSREAREIYRIVSLTAVILMAWEYGDEDDDSFTGQLMAKARRESLSLIQSLDPTLWLSTPRIATFLFDLGQNVKALLMLEEYETREGLKGVEGIKRQVTPAVVRQFSSNDN